MLKLIHSIHNITHFIKAKINNIKYMNKYNQAEYAEYIVSFYVSQITPLKDLECSQFGPLMEYILH